MPQLPPLQLSLMERHPLHLSTSSVLQLHSVFWNVYVRVRNRSVREQDQRFFVEVMSWNGKQIFLFFRLMQVYSWLLCLCCCAAMFSFSYTALIFIFPFFLLCPPASGTRYWGLSQIIDIEQSQYPSTVLYQQMLVLICSSVGVINWVWSSIRDTVWSVIDIVPRLHCVADVTYTWTDKVF